MARKPVKAPAKHKKGKANGRKSMPQDSRGRNRLIPLAESPRADALASMTGGAMTAGLMPRRF